MNRCSDSGHYVRHSFSEAILQLVIHHLLTSNTSFLLIDQTRGLILSLYSKRFSQLDPKPTHISENIASSSATTFPVIILSQINYNSKPLIVKEENFRLNYNRFIHKERLEWKRKTIVLKSRVVVRIQCTAFERL